MLTLKQQQKRNRNREERRLLPMKKKWITVMLVMALVFTMATPMSYAAAKMKVKKMI